MLTLFFGCAKPVDFNQLDDLTLLPVMETSIIFYNATAGDFFVGGQEENVAQDFVFIDVFNNGFVQDNLVRAEFVFETKNSINRAYSLQLDFLDVGGALLESFSINSPASPNNEVVASEHSEVFEGATLANIKQSRILVFTLEMLPGAPINQNSPGEIDLKSKGIFHLSLGE
ncbi:hypothetical protein [Algibacter sp. 2305UL17-15]|uniref:hypothetical protein n=1 Tax=Algibacter sp. 2305UL17-15 TaxID=3231268 RepID=UPI00345B3A91